MAQTKAYSIGVEEEYFLFDARTRRAITHANKRFLSNVHKRLGDRVTTEMLQLQIEAVTPVCESLPQAREYLATYRQALAEEARNSGLGVAAMGTFPLAFWAEQKQTQKARYDAIMDDLQMLGARNMLCGMHVHVSVEDTDARVNLMMRLVPYLPLLLALSTSSPFWQGQNSGLSGYRLAAYDELPRTGLPELFRTNEDYEEYIAALVRAGIIPDASHIWWAIRPSLKYPTIELRVADSCTRIDDAIGIAALFRCLVRMLERAPKMNAEFDRVGRAITAENKWHAQRYGIQATMVEPFRREAIGVAAWLDEIMDQIVDDIDALDCIAELDHLREVARSGTSADAQVEVYETARANGRQRLSALKDVVDWASDTTRACSAKVGTGFASEHALNL